VAALLYQEGQYAAATNQWNDALPVYREIYGAEHPEVATLLNNLGRSALMAGRVDEAIPLLERALQMDVKLKGPEHEELVMPLNSLGMAYLYEGDAARAQADIDQALKIARLPQHDEILDQVLLNAADLALAAHRVDEARKLLSEARQLLEARYSPAQNPGNQWRYAAWEAVHASLLAADSHPDDAREAFSRARADLVKRFGPQGFYVMRLDQREGVLKLAAAGAGKHP
jgi:tetratricopeptide (TPR) repeat protein